jgi:hypothetical protein
MTKILIEDDYFLKIVSVILAPATSDEHRRAVYEFFAHDVPDSSAGANGCARAFPGSLLPR